MNEDEGIAVTVEVSAEEGDWVKFTYKDERNGATLFIVFLPVEKAYSLAQRTTLAAMKAEEM